MNVMQIRTLGDPVLRETATPVVAFDETLSRLADDMLETMYAAPGVGLAANQVGLRMSCFVYASRGSRGLRGQPERPISRRETARGVLSIPPPPRTVRALAGRLRGSTSGRLLDSGRGLLARIFRMRPTTGGDALTAIRGHTD